MLEVLIFILFLIFFSLFFAASQFEVFHSKRRSARVELYVGGKSKVREAPHDIKEQKVSFLSQKIELIKTYIVNIINRCLSDESRRELQRKLRDAGYSKLSPIEFIMIQFGLGFLLFSLTYLPFSSLTESRASLLLLALVVGILGLYYPIFYLKKKKTHRVQKIEKLMPDYFDMVNLAIEAGMGLDAALQRVSKQFKSPLAEEMLRTLEDIKLGMNRRDAFDDLKERVPSELFQNMINAIIQGEQFGIGMAKVTKAQTHRIREIRKFKAKEEAQKAPVKMLFPMILFIFPTLFMVILGPLVIRLFTGGLF